MSVDNTEPGRVRDGRSTEVVKSKTKPAIKRTFPLADTAVSAIHEGIPTTWIRIDEKGRFHRNPEGTLIAAVAESPAVAQRDVQIASKIEDIIRDHMPREKIQLGLENFAGIDVASALAARTDLATGTTVIAHENKPGEIMPTTDRHERAWASAVVDKLNLFFTRHDINSQLQADNILIEHQGTMDFLHIISTGSFIEAPNPTARTTPIKSATRRPAIQPQLEPAILPDPKIVPEPAAPTESRRKTYVSRTNFPVPQVETSALSEIVPPISLTEDQKNLLFLLAKGFSAEQILQQTPGARQLSTIKGRIDLLGKPFKKALQQEKISQIEMILIGIDQGLIDSQKLLRDFPLEKFFTPEMRPFLPFMDVVCSARGKRQTLIDSLTISSRSLDRNYDDIAELLGATNKSKINEITALYAAAKKLGYFDIPSAQISTVTVEEPLPLPTQEQLTRLTGNRLRVGQLIKDLLERGLDPRPLMSPGERELLPYLFNPDLVSRSQIEVAMGGKPMLNIGRIIERLESGAPADENRPARVTLDNGNRIALVSQSPEQVHVTLALAREQVRAAYDNSLYAQIQELAARIPVREVGKETAQKAVAGLGGSPEEDQTARADLVTLYSGTIFGVLNQFNEFFHDRIDELSDVAIQGLRERVPHILSRTTDKKHGISSTITSLARQILVSHLEGSYVNEKIADDYFNVLRAGRDAPQTIDSEDTP